MRLIDADAFEVVAVQGKSDDFVEGAQYILEMIDNAPTVDAEPVRHGRWEWREDWGDTSYYASPELYDSGWSCNACGIDLLRYLQSHFPDIPSYIECACEDMPTLERCPHCGAKIDEK